MNRRMEFPRLLEWEDVGRVTEDQRCMLCFSIAASVYRCCCVDEISSGVALQR